MIREKVQIVIRLLCTEKIKNECGNSGEGLIL